MLEACEAWCTGIEGVLHMFGDNLPTDSGLMSQISQIVQETVTSKCFTSIHKYVLIVFEPRHDNTNIVRLRPAWIQTSLRSLIRIHAVGYQFSTCYRICKCTAWILIRLRGCADWSKSMLVAKALCWFCHDAAQFYINSCSSL
jgi:hypothetical protein